MSSACPLTPTGPSSSSTPSPVTPSPRSDASPVPATHTLNLNTGWDTQTHSCILPHKHSHWRFNVQTNVMSQCACHTKLVYYSGLQYQKSLYHELSRCPRIRLLYKYLRWIEVRLKNARGFVLPQSYNYCHTHTHTHEWTHSILSHTNILSCNDLLASNDSWCLCVCVCVCIWFSCPQFVA